MELTAPVVTAASFFLTSSVISNAFYQKKQFYPSVVYITKSSASMAVIYLQALVVVYLASKLLRLLFFGRLRAAETEHLADRAWHAVIETCLAFTVFRDDFSPRFVALFTFLLVIKCFHWLAEDRVDYMERSPVITIFFHFRMMCIIAVMSSVDSFFISHAYFSTVTRGASVQLVFGFEYAILLASVFMISVKYILHTLDLRNAHPWESKAVYLLYSELVLGFVKVLLYALFLVVMAKLHTFPLFSIRPMYLTLRSFKKTLNDVILSRKAINYMNTVYPNATQEELEQGDNVCIICREEMTTSAKKLPCNHIFHTACLRSWFQRQQSCPTCRLDILNVANPSVSGAAAAARAAAAQPAAGAGGGQPAGQASQQANGPAPPAGQTPAAQQPVTGAPAGQQQQQAQGQQDHMVAYHQLQRLLNPLLHQQVRPPHLLAANTTQSSSTSGGTQSESGPSTSTSYPTPPHLPGFPPFPFGTPWTTPGAGAGSAGSSHPVFSPPFAPPMPFMLPFPQPPSFAGLSDEEVSRMEGAARAAVEARVECLRNIQTLLDAVMIQLQQYLSILAAMTTSPEFSQRGTPGPSGRTDESGAPKPTSPTSPVKSEPPPEASGDSPPLPTQQETSPNSTQSDVGGAMDTNSTTVNNSSELDEVRRRRMERFGAKLS